MGCRPYACGMQADIGLGLLVAVLVSHLFGAPVTWGLAAFCVVMALLPDIDFLIEHYKHGSVGGTVVREHRELIHFPAIYLPIALAIGIMFGALWGVAFALCLLAHFLHDTVGIGWGIKWLWPLSRRNYKLLVDMDAHMHGPIALLRSWTDEEVARIATVHGIDGWVEKLYLKPFPIRVPMWMFWFMVLEWVVFFVGVAVFAFLV